MVNRDDLPPPVRERMRPEYWFDQANIPKQLQSTDWERFEGTGAEKAADIAFDLVEEWLNEDGIRGISLFGNPGRGKSSLVATMLCSLIEETMPTTLNGLFSEDVQGYFITLDEYHRLYLELYELEKWAKFASGDTSDAYAEWQVNFALRRFIEQEVPHLVLDDVGNEHHTTSGAVQDKFHGLIRGRYAKGLSTSLTSNLTDEKFIESYGAPQLSFIQESTQVVKVVGRDFRHRGRG